MPGQLYLQSMVDKGVILFFTKIITIIIIMIPSRNYKIQTFWILKEVIYLF